MRSGGGDEIEGKKKYTKSCLGHWERYSPQFQSHGRTGCVSCPWVLWHTLPLYKRSFFSLYCLEEICLLYQTCPKACIILSHLRGSFYYFTNFKELRVHEICEWKTYFLFTRVGKLVSYCQEWKSLPLCNKYREISILIKILYLETWDSE